MELIALMAEALYDRYDAINKMDAAKYLKTLFPKMKLKQFIAAYKLAYE